MVRSRGRQGRGSPRRQIQQTFAGNVPCPAGAQLEDKAEQGGGVVTQSLRVWRSSRIVLTEFNLESGAVGDRSDQSCLQVVEGISQVVSNCKFGGSESPVVERKAAETPTPLRASAGVGPGLSDPFCGVEGISTAVTRSRRVLRIAIISGNFFFGL